MHVRHYFRCVRSQHKKRINFGTGPMGLLIGLALKVGAAAEDNMVDLDPRRLELAEGL